MNGHQVRFDGVTSPLADGIKLARHWQDNGHVGEYVFVVGTLLGALAYVGEQPPFMHTAYVIVQKGKPPVWHYGMDSMLHPDWREYLKVFLHIERHRAGDV